jgi:DNA-directed RNA polymerase I and III subunit RPAC2
MNTDRVKLELVNDGTDDEYSKTFTINDEDHTLANALRYLIMKNANIIFCGYTIPHPSENKVNFKIQTNKKVTALDVLEKGLNDLNQVCDHVMETFKRAVDNFESNNQEQMEI